jgi:DNA-binding MarR family transcriptional regulator
MFTLHNDQMVKRLEKEVKRYRSRLKQMRKAKMPIERVTVSLTKKQLQKMERILQYFDADIQSLLYAFGQIGRYNVINQLR